MAGSVTIVGDGTVVLGQVLYDVAVNVGNGFTNIVNVESGPVQPLAVGVASINPLMTWSVVLVAVKGLMFPDPLAAKPIAVLVFVQAMVELAGQAVKFATVKLALAHMLSFTICCR